MRTLNEDLTARGEGLDGLNRSGVVSGDGGTISMDVVKTAVLNDLRMSAIHAYPKGRAVLKIAEEMKDEWWVRRQDKKAYEIVQELYRYFEERAARRERKEGKKKKEIHKSQETKEHQLEQQPREEQEADGRTEHTAVAAEAIDVLPRAELPLIDLACEVDDSIMAVLERTKEYYNHPDIRPPDPVQRRPLKNHGKLSDRSKIDYARTRRQISRELKDRGLSSCWDLVLQLVETARYKSKSTYKKQRAALLRSFGKNGQVCEMIKALPPYSEVCKILGREPSRNSTQVTEARRAKQDERTFHRLRSHLSPEHRDAILAIRYTGARSSEAASIRLQLTEEGVHVSIRSVKTGSRSKPGPATRSWTVPMDTDEAAILTGILKRRGEYPVPFSANALRATWRRARLKEGLNRDSRWDLHSLRHQYAKDLKQARTAELREKHGPDWRRKLYGKNWRGSPRYIEDFYGPIARRLGHTNSEMAKIYG